MARGRNAFAHIATRDGAVFYTERRSSSAVAVTIGSSDWVSMLGRFGKVSFHPFASWNGYNKATMSCRREKRGSRYYWYGYMKRGGRTVKKYIGKSEKMTFENMRRVYFELAAK